LDTVTLFSKKVQFGMNYCNNNEADYKVHKESTFMAWERGLRMFHQWWSLPVVVGWPYAAVVQGSE